MRLDRTKHNKFATGAIYGNTTSGGITPSSSTAPVVGGGGSTVIIQGGGSTEPVKLGLGNLTNVGAWANEVATEDRFLVQIEGSNQWVAKPISDIIGDGEGNAYNKLDNSYFDDLFEIIDEDGNPILPNNPEGKTIASIKAKFGLWSEHFISVKGAADESGTVDAPYSKLSLLTDVAITQPAKNGQILVYRNGYWVNEDAKLGGGSADTDYVDDKFETLDKKKVDVAFFKKIFGVIDSESGQEIAVNDVSFTEASIKAKFGLWTEEYLSALGYNPENNPEQGGGGSGSGGIDKDELLEILTQEQYAKLTDIPVNISEFTNDAGYITGSDLEPIREDILDNKGRLDWVETTLVGKLDTKFFARAFDLIGEDGEPIRMNTYDQVAKSIRANLGLWSFDFLSALGINVQENGKFGLNSIPGVEIKDVAPGQVLIYEIDEETQEGRWINKDVSSLISLKEDIVINSSNVGYYKKGDTIKKGTTWDEIFETMFYRPTGAELETILYINGSVFYGSNIEYGTSKTDCYIMYVTTRNSNGAMTNAYYDGNTSNKLSFSAEDENGEQIATRNLDSGYFISTETYTATVLFAASEDGKVPQATLNSTKTLKPCRRWFCGPAASTIDLNNITNDDVWNLNYSALYYGNGTYSCALPMGWRNVLLCIPGSGRVIEEGFLEIQDTVNIFADPKTVIRLNDVMVTDKNGNSETAYSVWQIKADIPYDQDDRLTFNVIG